MEILLKAVAWMDFFSTGIMFQFLFLALLISNTYRPDLCSATERSKQVSIKERGSLAFYCYFGPSATLNVMAFVCVQASVFNDCENVRLVLECLDLSILYTCCRVHLCVHTSS